MGNSCTASGFSVTDEILPGGGDNYKAEMLISIPGAEVLLLDKNGKDGAVTERGTFGLYILKPGSKTDSPGKYCMSRPGMVTAAADSGSADVCRIEAGTPINVVEVVRKSADKRVRARIDDPAGWISLENMDSKARWAEKLSPGVLFVGDKFGSPADKNGFYYPMSPEMPVILVWETRTLTVSAMEGDTFSIRLPLEVDEATLQDLIGRLPIFCNFTMQKKKEVADYVSNAGGGVAATIGWAADWGVKAIQKSGETTRAKTKKEEEVQVGMGTKLALAGAKKTTGTAVAVGGAVIDGLLNTAVVLGKAAGKEMAAPEDPAKPAQPEGTGGKAGKAALAQGLQIFDALIKASDKLSSATADETAAVVGHKYGKDAGAAARTGMSVGGDVLALQDMVGKKAVGKLAAKGAMYTVGGVVEGAVAGGGAAPSGSQGPPRGGS